LVTGLFALANTQANGNPQAEPEVTVPGMISTSSDNGAMPTRTNTLPPSVRYGFHVDLNQVSVTLEQPDVGSLTLKAPNQIGVNRSLAVSSTTRAQKFVNPDGSQLIVLIIKSSGASGIGVHFRNFALAAGEEVYVYGPRADSIVCGPYTNKGPWGSGEFWSSTIAGETVVIEFYTTTDKNGKGFEIFEISHIFAELDWRLRSNEPDVLNCEVDASCYGDVEKNAVGRMLFNDNGVFVCTGTLLNDRAQDQTPYFLTANHCIPTQGVAQTVEIYWFYQTTSCNSGVLRSWVQSPPGANLLATQSSNDFSLLRLFNNAPAGAWFAGWTNAAQSQGTNVFGLHHPGPYVPPDVPSYLRRASGTITSTSGTCLANGCGINWTTGLTEPGSSGSGLFTANGHQLVGVLSCGPTACNNPYDNYSKFANFYPQIRSFIYPGTTPKYDFNGDGHPDYVLYNGGTRQTAVWYMNNNIFLSGALGPTPPAGAALIDVADFNGDGHPDAVLFNPSTQGTIIGYLNNNVLIGSAYGPTLPNGWQLAATGDFNGDENPDYVLYKPSTNQTAIWYLNNNVYLSGGYGPTLPASWSVVGLADFDGDRKTDYLLFNPTSRESAIWYLSGRALVRAAFGPTIARGYHLRGAADFNGDGKPDYALFNATTRQSAIWYLNNNVYITGAPGPTLPAGWSLVAP
jgi:hypothetical protein